MATTTTNNGWTIPQSSDLVTNGATAIATLGSGIDTSVGTGLLAWTAFTPTLTNWGVGNGTWDSYYVQIGKTVIWRCKFTVGSTTTKSGSPTFSLPVTARSASAGVSSNIALLLSAGAMYYGSGYLASTTTYVMSVMGAAGTYVNAPTISPTVPGTWTTSDYFAWELIYEAA